MERGSARSLGHRRVVVSREQTRQRLIDVEGGVFECCSPYSSSLFTIDLLTDDLGPEHTLELHDREQQRGVLKAEAENAAEGQVAPTLPP